MILVPVMDWGMLFTSGEHTFSIMKFLQLRKMYFIYSFVALQLGKENIKHVYLNTPSNMLWALADLLWSCSSSEEILLRSMCLTVEGGILYLMGLKGSQWNERSQQSKKWIYSCGFNGITCFPIFISYNNLKHCIIFSRSWHVQSNPHIL